MISDLNLPDGSTPLTPDEFAALIPGHIVSQAELNAAEQMNVAQGLVWLTHKKLKPNNILTRQFICELHKRLFGNVWKWAGKFRKSDKNIGVDWLHIDIELRKLVNDVIWQIDNFSYSPIEIALRFHHRLVQIHPFPNGNGRHSRIITDHLVTSLSVKPLTWGGHNIQSYSQQTERRKQYIKALRNADQGKLSDLLQFAI